MDHITPNPAFYNIPFSNIETFNGMPYRPLGTSGLRVSNIGLGTWKIGYPETGDESRINEKQAFLLFEKAIELGVTFWDTANRYNNASGNSERIIGKWLKSNSAQRRNVVLSTKIFGGMDGLTPNHFGLSRANILDSVYACLERLQVDYIDLLYFHAFDRLTQVEESLMVIEDLVRQDLVRYFGASNFTIQNLKAFESIQSNRTIRSRITAVQNQYDILNGESPSYRGVLENVFQMGISFIAWSPLAKGLLTERYLNNGGGKGDRLFDEGILKESLNDSNAEKLNRLGLLSRQWDMELSQLALSYLLTLPGMGPVIPSSATPSQLESNAIAGRIKLSEHQQMQVRKILNYKII